MKKCFAAALLALPLLAVPARAEDVFAPGPPFRVECGANAYFRVLNRQNGWGCQLGPWYSYWPMEAHFQTPALPQYPFWPAPQAVVPGGTASNIPVPACKPSGPVAAPAAAAAPAPAAPQAVRPAYYYNPAAYANGYYYGYQQPAWWNGR